VTRTPDAPEQAANNDSRDASAPATKPQHGGAEKTSAEEQSIGSVAAAVDTQQTPVEAAGPETDGWHWPTTGKLLRSYNPSSRHQGIEIGGKKGAAVHAASSGKVVYNGSGLKGYGRLIIIKHNQHYLSAYGFLQQSLVKEGQTVQADAHIADMGLGPGNKPMLLFEIRRDGDPIDPQKVLPKR
jgi:lipoprotein NlpD